MVGGTDSFSYTGDPAGTISTQDGTITEAVAPGSQYVSTEAAKAGWNLTDVSCDSAHGAGDKAARTATFNPAAGETITFTFTNTKQATLTVRKVLVPSSDSGKFNLRVDGNTVAADVGDGGANTAVYSLGSHTVSETAGTGTDLSDYTSVIGGDCAADGSVSLAAGENKTCTITNTAIPPTITVGKRIVGQNDQGKFTFVIDSGASPTQIVLDNDGQGFGDDESSDPTDVSTGDHTVSETGHGNTSLADYTSTWSCGS